jgi:hypothetical protein
LDGSPLTESLSPPYYSAIIAAEAIRSSGSTQAVELSINNAQIAGYALYEYGILVRVVFIQFSGILDW